MQRVAVRKNLDLVWVWFYKEVVLFNRMATNGRKLDAKNQSMIAIIICCIGVFIFPFLSGCANSGSAYMSGVSGLIVDKNGKPLSRAYIVYDYHNDFPRFPEGSTIYIINPAIAVTDTNGQFTIPSPFVKKGRPELKIFAAYYPITHSAFSVDTSQKYQTITLQDNTNDLKAWEKDLNALEKGYGWLMFDVSFYFDEFHENLVVTNKEEFEAMIQSERRLLNERKGNDDVTLDSLKKEFEFSVLRDKLSLAIHNKITENLYTNNFDGAIAVYTTVIEQKPSFFYAYVGRGEVKKEKGDLNGALDDYSTALNMQPSYILGRLERGELEKEMGNFDAATADYDMVIKRPFAYQGRDFVKGSDLRAFGYEGRGFVKQAQGNLIGAQADFNQALKLDSTILAPILTNVDSMSITNSK